MAVRKDAMPVGSTENPYSTPQESPDSGTPRRSNQNQSHRCSLSGWSVLLLDSQASEGSPPVQPGSASTRQTAVRVAASESEIFTPDPASARGDASQRENGGMPSRLRCALYPPPFEALPRAVRGKRANPGAVPQISA